MSPRNYVLTVLQKSPEIFVILCLFEMSDLNVLATVLRVEAEMLKNGS